MMPPRRSRLRGDEGFSLAEILVVLTLTTIGFIAVINLQIGTLEAVTTARNTTEATNLAEHVIELIRSDAIEWTADGETTVATQFPYLSEAGIPVPGGGSDWVLASLSPDRVGSLGDTFLDDEGRNDGILSEFPNTRNRRFCVHYRLTWIILDYLLRADVRVSWMRGHITQTEYQDCPDLAADSLDMFDDVSQVSSVTIPATIMRNVFATSTTP
jgi:type II secretory pathway pseudopilin PulG